MTGQVSPVAVLAGELIVILIGNGASPEVFAASATINTSRAIDLSVATTTAEVPDAANPGAAAVTVRAVKSQDCKITGAGLADGPSIPTFVKWGLNPGPKNIIAGPTMTGANGGFTITGPFIMTAFNLTGIRAEKATFTATFEQAGQLTYAANA